MIRTLHRVRGASAVGARHPGETGPFGPYGGDEDGGQDGEQHDQDHDDPQPERNHMPNSRTADQWNARYPAGTPVVAYPLTRPEDKQPDFFERLETVTRSRAWTLGHGVPVVSVDGYAGGIVLTHIDPTD